MYHYQAFNLHFITPFECPGLTEVAETQINLPKVNVSFGTLPEKLDNPLNIGPVWEAKNNEFLLKVKDVGRYLIRNANEIVIDAYSDATETQLRLFLFGSAMAALLNQRGYFVLHASAIATEKGAVLIMGHSGAGKSTTVQALVNHGYKLLSDDAIALYCDEPSKKVMAIPSYPNIKLWEKSAQMLKIDTKGRTRVDANNLKYNIDAKDSFTIEPTALYVIYQLGLTNDSSKISLEETNEVEKFKLLFANKYRRRYAEKLICKENHFRISLEIVKDTRIKCLNRPNDKNTIEAVVQCLENDFNT